MGTLKNTQIPRRSYFALCATGAVPPDQTRLQAGTILPLRGFFLLRILGGIVLFGCRRIEAGEYLVAIGFGAEPDGMFELMTEVIGIEKSQAFGNFTDTEGGIQ